MTDARGDVASRATFVVRWALMRRGIGVMLVLIASVVAVAAGPRVDELMMDMQITPIDAVKAPPLSVTTLDGARVTLADMRGHVVLVYFWATW